MTWRDKMVIRILLIIAKMFSDDPEVTAEIRDLQNHIIVGRDEL